MCFVVAAAAVADMSAPDAWLLMVCLQAAAGAGGVAKSQVPCTQHILHYATPLTATTPSATTSCMPWAQPGRGHHLDWYPCFSPKATWHVALVGVPGLPVHLLLRGLHRHVTWRAGLVQIRSWMTV